MEEMNIPQNLIAFVRATMRKTKCQIKIQNMLSSPIITRNGVRLGDSLACLLFNIALEKVERYAGINTRGTIFYKSVQILAFADDFDIIGRTQKSMKEAFPNLQRAAKKVNLQITQNKTKYMPVTKNECANRSVHIEIGSYKFETVCSFTYIGSEVNCKNGITDEIKKACTGG
jgi:sorting nexin-29